MKILEEQGGKVRGTSQHASEVVAFIIDRLRFYGRQHLGLREDVMEAVTHLTQSAVL